ncbi:TPA: hypothetical protein GX533_03220 [Candidatus Dojkabacteria bacterium]|uniref:DUF4932 domain-containing protein n=1 Tax=Candidatus Dojkabacteria bacterium TaxID=2099670 RepID=A0A832QDZ3_9BACT|nr:hypothetical protein [Candidatus Dojkabacteria bacterium]
MLKVKTNKNVVFLTLLINFLYPKEKEQFYLYTKIKEKFAQLIPQSFITNFKNTYGKDNQLSILYKYICLSIYLDSNFDFDFKDGEVYSDKFSKDVSFFKKHLKKLYRSIDFDSFYSTNIEKEYKELCKNIEEIFNRKPNILDILTNYWELNYTPEFVFIPNFVALGDCFGLNREGKFFSVTSPKVNKVTGKSEYYPVHVYSNTIHELSHSFFDEKIHVKYSKKELMDKVEKLGLNEEVLRVYGSAYFEECFVRAVTMRLNEIVNIYDLDDKGLKEKVKNYLLSNDNLGYPLVRFYYEKLMNREGESLQAIFESVL